MKKKKAEQAHNTKLSKSLDCTLQIYLGGGEDSPGIEPSGGEGRLLNAFSADAAAIQEPCMKVLERARSVGDAWSQSSAEMIAEQIESRLSEELPELSPLTLKKLVNWYLFQWK